MALKFAVVTAKLGMIYGGRDLFCPGVYVYDDQTE